MHGKSFYLFIFRKEIIKILKQREKICATGFNRSFLAKLLYATGASENKNYDIALEELRKAAILAGNNKEIYVAGIIIKS